jgi:hypothetical protein
MCRVARLSVLCILAAWLPVPGLLADGLVFTEFMAGKNRVLMDEDRDFPDWIEILNAGTAPVNLNGYHLTDQPKDLTKWTFPDVTLGQGKFLVVFASEKDRRVPGKNLHTNFRIDALDGVLALLDPAGRTILSKFDPYPYQAPNTSYGVGMEIAATALVAEGAAVKAFVPIDAGLGSTWLDPAFDDSTWTDGVTGVGFDKKPAVTFADLVKMDVGTAMDRVNTSAYLRIPFSVDDPSRFGGLVLRVRYDDGFIAYLNGKEVVRRNAPTNVGWNARAPVRRAETAVLEAEEINLSALADLLVPGRNLLAIQGLNNAKTDPDFLILPELLGTDVTSVSSDQRYFTTPSPGLPHAGGEPALADEPEFSHPGGPFTDNFALTLTTRTPNATIRYTLDRTLPTEASAAYTEPITIDKTVMVRARTFAPGRAPSPFAVRTFVPLDPTMQAFSSNLPIVILTTFGRQPQEGTFTPVQVSLIDSGPDGRATPFLEPNYIGGAKVKIRGSSSLGFPKKSFNFEIDDIDGDDLDVSLLNMPADSDWILYAPYTDKTLMRDLLSYDWSNDMGRYAPRGKFVEVFIHNGAAKMAYGPSYVGVYVLLDKIKRHPLRVNIERLHISDAAQPEITGGYIFKKDRLDPGDSGLSGGGHTFGMVEPKERVEEQGFQVPEITPQQRTYLSSFLNTFAGVLNGVNFKDPVNGYAKFIDIDSFIDQHILVELAKNIDGYRLSSFYYKDRNGKLHMGPAWDYNLSLGNADYLDGWKPDGWYYALVGDGDYPFFRRLQQDPAFVQRYSERWVNFRQGPLKLANLLAAIDGYAQRLAEAQVRNYRKWPILGTYVWPNKFIGRTYEEELNFMRQWLRDRVAWMDSQLVPGPTLDPSPPASGQLQVEAGSLLTITARPDLEIYYTLDGADPRQPDASPAPSAVKYTGPITIARNTRIQARTRKGAEVWGGLKSAILIVDMPPLVISEILFAPALPPGAAFPVNDFEFVELKNIGTQAFNLSGVKFTRGITFDFTGDSVATLGPGEHVVVVRNRDAFASRYDTNGMHIAGPYTGDFSNSGELLTLVGPDGEILHDFRYATSWYPEAAQQGLSYVVPDTTVPRDKWGVKETWRPSRLPGGSPGADDPAEPPSLQLPGDLNQTGTLNVTDAILLTNHLFGGAALAPLPCEGGTIADAGNRALLDMDGSGAVDVTDAIRILSYLFARGAPPALGTSCVVIEGCPQGCTQ